LFPVRHDKAPTGFANNRHLSTTATKGNSAVKTPVPHISVSITPLQPQKLIQQEPLVYLFVRQLEPDMG
jgi:hypothetical protein